MEGPPFCGLSIVFSAEQIIDIFVKIIRYFAEIFKRDLPLTQQIPRDRRLRNADPFGELPNGQLPYQLLQILRKRLRIFGCHMIFPCHFT